MSKIYTKRGDAGYSDTISAQDIPKYDATFSAMGDIDELNTVIGLVIATSLDIADNTLLPKALNLQHVLFDAGSMIAIGSLGESEKTQLSNETSKLEKAIDAMNEVLEPLTYFILPSGSELIARAHHARTVCRRAERSVWAANEMYAPIGTYLNRMSDYLFTLARYAAHKEGVSEVRWLKSDER